MDEIFKVWLEAKLADPDNQYTVGQLDWQFNSEVDRFRDDVFDSGFYAGRDEGYVQGAEEAYDMYTCPVCGA